MKREASVLLVDDHPVFRGGLRRLLEQEKGLKIAGEAADGQTALELVGKHSPDLVVMDITMPNLDGIEATRRIVSKYPATKVVALSMHSSKRFVNDMLSAGAVGYILKESIPEEMIEGIWTVLAGQVYLSRAISGVVVSESEKPLADYGPAAAPDPILFTKLHPPPISADLIARPRLIQLLDEGRHRAITLISAPAGYGKSILASQWLESRGAPRVWFSLDENDNDIRLFLTYVLEGIAKAFPAEALKTRSLLAAANLPSMKVVARYLLNDIDLIDEPFILVLDDYHRINDAAVHDFVSELLRYPSPMLHLMVLTRHDPSLPLSPLKGQGQLTEIRMEHLRFTSPETGAFLERHLRTDLDEDQAAKLEAKIEGWAAGLRLASLSLVREGDIDRLLAGLESDSFYYINEYLIREVLSSAPKPFARYLMATSILDQFCAPLCEALFPSRDDPDEAETQASGPAFIHWLEQTNLFVTALDSKHYWFRFHHLFQELLRKQAETEFSPEEIITIHLRACEWLMANGLIEKAIHHALAGGHEVRAAELVEESRQAMLNDDNWHVVARWISLLPSTLINQRPQLLAGQAGVAYFRNQPAAIPPLIEKAESILGPGFGESPVAGELEFFTGFQLGMQNKIALGLDHCQRALELIPENCHTIKGVTEGYYYLFLCLDGHQERAIAGLNHLLHGDEPPAPARALRLLTSQIFIHIISGDLDQALIPCQQLRELALQQKSYQIEKWSNYGQGLVHFHRNELDPAIAYFQKAAKEIYSINGLIANDLIAGLILAHQALLQPDQADAMVELLLTYAPHQKNDPVFEDLALSCQAHLAILRGDVRSAIQRFRTKLPRHHRTRLFGLETPVLTYCRALVAEGSDQGLREAEEKLTEYLKVSQDQHNVLNTIEITLLLAMANHQQGRNAEALELLSRAVELAQPGRFIRFFVELGEPIADLLNRLVRKGIKSDFIFELLDALEVDQKRSAPARLASSESGRPSLPTIPRRSSRPQPLIEPLTNRELDILELLARRLRTKEIAEQFHVSPATVKTHLRNIFQKLNANNRREAVEIAKSLGVLKTD
jgi:LuxR family transcriptional regulator, maltose regulon positive regulatory protein